MSAAHWSRAVLALNPCDEARKWLATNAHLSPSEAWEACERADWMLWLAAQAGVDRCAVVLAACDCAETSLHLATPDVQMAGALALHLSREWAEGREDVETVRAAGTAAYDADAHATTNAAYAAYAAAAAAAYAANAASGAHGGEHAQLAALRNMAALGRRHISALDVMRALEALP